MNSLSIGDWPTVSPPILAFLTLTLNILSDNGGGDVKSVA